MTDHEKEIARKYLLPERPFLHGVASAFDLFGVLGQGTLEQLRENSEMSAAKHETLTLRAIWLEVGETLLSAIDRHEQEAGEGSRS